MNAKKFRKAVLSILTSDSDRCALFNGNDTKFKNTTDRQILEMMDNGLSTLFSFTPARLPIPKNEGFRTGMVSPKADKDPVINCAGPDRTLLFQALPNAVIHQHADFFIRCLPPRELKELELEGIAVFSKNKPGQRAKMVGRVVVMPLQVGYVQPLLSSLSPKGILLGKYLEECSRNRPALQAMWQAAYTEILNAYYASLSGRHDDEE